MRKPYLLAATAAILNLVFLFPVQAAEVSGAGSTFVAPLVWKWSEIYKSKSSDQLSYVSIGSGAGIAKMKERSVDFGATDMPLPSKELARVGLGQFPIIIGGVVPVVNIAGVKPGQMRFTGKILADIFLGQIENWSDPAIKALNSDLSLPNAKIAVVHRADGSGTTYNWLDFLSKTNTDWRDRVGEGINVAWPVGVGAKGNEGVAASVRQIKNSLGYVEYTYVLQSDLTFGLVQNRAGNFIAPSNASFIAAAENIDWRETRDFYVTLTDALGEDAYPITATTFILMAKEAKSPERSRAAIRFFQWGLDEGQKPASELGYVPLPPSLVAKVHAYWKSEFHSGI